ncbi:MAG TPA: hypothetical protein VLA98_00355 [Solirubrobacteraceae bacterium]|nr:hypothetical protein [Solirubrobacteraceae bacterium]HSD79032.1 hypothetical protein [Solirubrobacteraceae bacterium]
MRLRLLTPVLVLALGLALGACGNKEPTTEFGATEGAYLDVGDLKYQVQISRELNPDDLEDRGYLVGADQRTVRPEETWFAVFMRVQNSSDTAHEAARDFELSDTQGNKWRPVPLPAQNVFAYRPVNVPGQSVLPFPDSPAAENTIQGSLLLFKIPFANLANRPLVLKVVDPTDPQHSAEVDLDV